MGRSQPTSRSLLRSVARRAVSAGAALALLLGALIAALPAPVAYAATFTVTKTADTNDGTCNSDCSLREAIAAANAAGGAQTVAVPAGTYTLDTALATGDDALQIGPSGNISVTINGAGAASTIIRTDAATCGASGTKRVFDLDPNVMGNVAVSISGVTISNGAAQAFGGGAILGGGAGDSLALSNAVISNNCTFGANSAAGISWSPAGNVTISNTTFSNNASSQGAGGAINYTTGN